MFEELWSRYKFEQDSFAREELLTKCLPLVKSLAQRFSVYALPCCDVDDLVSLGIIGLMDALEKFGLMQNAVSEGQCLMRYET
jgi:DNA-directed RNA polymerase specialized sigma subunit